MAATFSVRVTGVKEVRARLQRLPGRVDARLWEYARSSAPRWEALLKAVIEHVVYDAYDPKVYRRNKNLIRAVDRKAERFSSAGVRGSRVRLFDNAERIRLARAPVGGASPDEVPWQIELGAYPQPWYGFTAPRPAYRTTADLIRTEVNLRARKAVSEAVLAP